MYSAALPSRLGRVVGSGRLQSTYTCCRGMILAHFVHIPNSVCRCIGVSTLGLVYLGMHQFKSGLPIHGVPRICAGPFPHSMFWGGEEIKE